MYGWNLIVIYIISVCSKGCKVYSNICMFLIVGSRVMIDNVCLL